MKNLFVLTIGLSLCLTIFGQNQKDCDWVRVKKLDKSKVIKGVLTNVDSAGLIVFNFKKQTYTEVLAGEIKSIKISKGHRTQRITNSTMIGILSGAAFGVLTGYALADRSPCTFLCLSPEIEMTVGGVLGSAVGIIGGLVVGLDKKKINVYGNKDLFIEEFSLLGYDLK